MTTQSPQTVLILGAGLTGLSTAYHLSRQGYRVTLLDHPSWQDGFQANVSDASPILFGCHHETWRLLHTLDADAPSQTGTTLPLEFRLPDGRIVPYRSAHLPGALQWMMSLFSFHGLAWHDRWKLFSHVEQIWEQAQSLPADLDNRTADAWLATIGQSQEARHHMWEPLAKWLTGNALTRLSAATFVQLLSTVFLGQAVDARLTYFHGSVGDRFLAPLRATLEQLGAVLQPHTDLPNLHFEQDRLGGVQLRDGTLLHADWYVAALPHRKLLALLPERLLTRYAYFAQIGELTQLSEITVQFDSHSTTRTPRLILLADSPFHQLTISALGPQDVRYRLSAIGNHTLADARDGELIELGRTELRMLNPAIEADGIQSMEVYREEEAALSLPPGTALLRPIQQSPIPNVLVAGAWTDTGWPTNIESALVSARHCVDAITKTAEENQSLGKERGSTTAPFNR